MRDTVNTGLDRKVFRHTAVKTKAVNLGNVSSRGGIRF